MQGVLGTFDSLNPFIVKGLPAQGLRGPLVSGGNIISGYVVESLMARGYDEPFTLYGLLARTVETDAARSYVTFTLDPAARFSDGKPVTPEDVIFSWQLLRDKGRPNHRFYYSKVNKAEAVGERAVRFDLAGSNDRELPLILGLMPVLAKHAVNPETFEETSFAPLDRQRPLYRRQGRSGQERHARARSQLLGARSRRSIAASGISTRSVSTTTATPTRYHEAFKRGLFDLRTENDPGRWQTAYDFPGAARRPRGQGDVPDRPAEGELSTSSSTRAGRSSRTSACAKRSRCCSTSNGSTTIYSSISTGAPRAISRARNSPRAAAPADARERALLAPFPDAVRADVLDGTWSPPVTDGSGRDRAIAAARARAVCQGRATSCAAPSWSTGAAAGRSPSRSWSAAATRSGWRSLFAQQPQARRNHSAGARGRCGAVRGAPHRLRFRHDPEPLGPIALARQRAGLLLELGRRRPATAAATTWASRARRSTR